MLILDQPLRSLIIKKEMLIFNQPPRSLGHCMGSGGGEPDPLLAIERKYGNGNAAREEGKKF